MHIHVHTWIARMKLSIVQGVVCIAKVKLILVETVGTFIEGAVVSMRALGAVILMIEQMMIMWIGITIRRRRRTFFTAMKRAVAASVAVVLVTSPMLDSALIKSPLRRPRFSNQAIPPVP